MGNTKSECIFNEKVHVKEEEDDIKEEPEWEDSTRLRGISAAAARAGLYVNHEVKDELVLGPAGVQPADAAFTLYACQASAARAQPVPRDCVARPERHVANNADVGNQVHSNANIHAEKETYLCDICNKTFALKTELVEHVMIHIHQEPEQEEICVVDNAEARAPIARQHPALRDCVVKLERLEVAELEAGRNERLASRAGRDTDIEKEIHGNIDVSTEEETYICDTCKKWFPLKSQLVDHVMSYIQRRESGRGSACQASAARAQPELSDCVARRERHVANNADVGNQVHSNANIHTEQETYVCDICNKRFALKTELVEHVMIHIHQEPEQEEIRVADNAAARAPNAREHPAPRDCVVKLDRLEVAELEAGRDERLASRAGRDTDIEKEIHGIIDVTTEEEIYICDTCKKWFPLKGQLVDHVMSHIQRRESGRGSACQASAARAQPVPRDCVARPERSAGLTADARRPERHVANNADVGNQVHSNANIHTKKETCVCDICNKRFALKTQLVEHVMIHIRQEPEQEEIRVADNAARAPNARQRPALRDCVVKLERLEVAELEAGRDERLASRAGRDTGIEKEIHGNIDVSTEEETYICDTCKKRFPLKNQLVDHVMSHIQRRESGRGSARGRRGKGREPTRAPGCRYACLKCYKDFLRPSQLKRHELTHTEERPFCCEICKQKFKDLDYLKRHERIHTGEKRYSCGICTKQFAWFTSLKIHESTHSAEKPFYCRICKQKFRESCSLKRHEQTHTGERPFCCGICKQKFARLITLKRHERIHTGEKPFRCGRCKKKFARLITLKRHERTHTGEKPFRCGRCKKKFARSHHLKRHERTHTGEKPFACDICKKQFTQLGHLKDHKDQIHADWKPFCCDICQKRFAQKTSLVGHIRRHRTAKPR